ncbi:hypothetical protein PX52LOC_06387 [Limnoglobus roseus]|uniref:Uncharacterized protein n=1 Tax=Limnoglobus roseus TaxID=2598579 RepID=A0A5C1AIQ4_9BACT|nr:hypothetical protein PX52LOC_06387 [Limnoglobus roseus]
MYHLRKGTHVNKEMQSDYASYGEGAFVFDEIKYTSAYMAEIKLIRKYAKTHLLYNINGLGFSTKGINKDRMKAHWERKFRHDAQSRARKANSDHNF